MGSDEMISRNPATGEVIARSPCTPPDSVTAMVARARSAQGPWSSTSWTERRAALARAWRSMSAEADDWAEAIVREIGKPRDEARIEVATTLDQLRWLVRRGGRALADQKVGAGWQAFMGLGTARIRWVPYGVIGKLGTWNYPVFLNVPPIAAALGAGNAVVWKPSENANAIGLKIQGWLDRIGLPGGLMQTVVGGPEAGRALLTAGIDKAMFTGGLGGGRAILKDLGSRGIPAAVELSGFDPAIVLPDAPLSATADALAWSAFVGCGQTCVSIKRVYVLGDPLPWAQALAERAKALRPGDPSRDDVDIGPMISKSARERFDAQVHAAIAAGARILAGGSIPSEDGPGAFYPPTVLLADNGRAEGALSGCFGPMAIVRGVDSLDRAVEAANASEFALAASVWGRDRRAARSVADRLRAGVVGINEATTTTAHAGAPFGGLRSSGFGRVHGAIGLREFAQPSAYHERRAGGFRPQLFPYGRGRLGPLLAIYRRLFHPPG
ncbi:MAG: aldehyde dehydrogenase family protein [Isosphaeraceae bacterium]